MGIDRDFLFKQADFELLVHNEDIPIRGNAIASGDDECDKKVEDEIIRRLENGDIWAWCCVEVRATFGTFTGSDFLGGCSYASEEEFKAPGGYYEDMRVRAGEDLMQNMELAKADIERAKQ